MQLYSNDIAKVYPVLKGEYAKHRMPVVELIEVQTSDPFKVLVTTILSARTKDQTTAQAARRLFTKVHTAHDFAHLSQKEIEELIYPVGFYHDKARHLKELPGVLDVNYNGVIPHTVEELVVLPGVGRKTANLVVAVAFNLPAICVDVHVHRISNRLGYVATKTPFETEMALRAHLPEKYWITFNSYLVSFGQNRCKPVYPLCGACPIRNYCQYFVENDKAKAAGTKSPSTLHQ